MIKEINGVSYVKESKGDTNSGDDSNDEKKSGCGGSVASVSALLPLAVLGAVMLIIKKKEV